MDVIVMKLAYVLIFNACIDKRFFASCLHKNFYAFKISPFLSNLIFIFINFFKITKLKSEICLKQN